MTPFQRFATDFLRRRSFRPGQPVGAFGLNDLLSSLASHVEVSDSEELTSIFVEANDSEMATFQRRHPHAAARIRERISKLEAQNGK